MTSLWMRTCVDGVSRNHLNAAVASSGTIVMFVPPVSGPHRGYERNTRASGRQRDTQR
jgi:hypothetical protein